MSRVTCQEPQLRARDGEDDGVRGPEEEGHGAELPHQAAQHPGGGGDGQRGSA